MKFWVPFGVHLPLVLIPPPPPALEWWDEGLEKSSLLLVLHLLLSCVCPFVSALLLESGLKWGLRCPSCIYRTLASSCKALPFPPFSFPFGAAKVFYGLEEIKRKFINLKIVEILFYLHHTTLFFLDCFLDFLCPVGCNYASVSHTVEASYVFV